MMVILEYSPRMDQAIIAHWSVPIVSGIPIFIGTNVGGQDELVLGLIGPGLGMVFGGPVLFGIGPSTVAVHKVLP
ncbi:hypothetical protein Q3G72_025522 [Acer saccharum]|nr:hypothetical protein Q3G72_025522 [Acer saccharum]